MTNKKIFFTSAVFILCVSSFFAEWISSENFTFVSYSYFLLTLYSVRCFFLCVFMMDFLELCKCQISLFFEAIIFSPAVLNAIFILCEIPFNSMLMYSRIMTILQIIVITSVFLYGIIAKKLLNSNSFQNVIPNDFSKLSTREKEVAELLLKGKTNNEIAEILFISNTTVKSHIQHIFEKYEVRNRMEFANKIKT